VGTNELSLEVGSDFTGGITVDQGTLILESPADSASGPGPVVVNRATSTVFMRLTVPS